MINEDSLDHGNMSRNSLNNFFSHPYTKFRSIMLCTQIESTSTNFTRNFHVKLMPSKIIQKNKYLKIIPYEDIPHDALLQQIQQFADLSQ